MKDRCLGLLDFVVTALQFLVSYTDLLIVWSCLLLWEAFAGKPLSFEIKRSSYLGAFIAISFWNWRKQLLRARAAEAALAAGKKKLTPARAFVQNPEALLERYGRTGTLSERLLIPYLDKWIQISGSFEGAADSLVGDATFISLILQNGRRIQLRFPGDRGCPVRLLRAGQQITAGCQIQHGYGAGIFVLDNCELIRTEACRPALARVS
jgi:hypothetical protein